MVGKSGFSGWRNEECVRHVTRISPKGGGGRAEVSKGPRLPLPKTKNYTDLAHFFREGPKFTTKCKNFKDLKLRTAH